jgi:hypothetical protein
VTATYSNGAATIVNSDAEYMWYISHSMATKYSNFTLSATVTFPANAASGVGVICCKTDSGAIIVQLGTLQNLNVTQFTAKEQKTLLDVYNSFVTTTSNVITVSKRESTFNFFCNGNFLGSATVTDSRFTAGGDIGMMLADKTSATFDDFVMTDDFKTGSNRTCYSDDFNRADMTGWYIYTVTGTAQPSGGQMVMTNTDGVLSSLLFTHGDYTKASLKTVAEFRSGKGVYGCMFVYTEPTAEGNRYKTYSFLVDSTQRYGISHPDSSMIKVNVPKSYVHGSTGSKKDTLEILRFGGRYQFKINGNVAEDALPIPSKAPDAVGFYVGPKTSVAFDMFSAGGDSSGAFCPVNPTSGKQAMQFAPLLRVPSGGVIALDALGRINKRFSGNYSAELVRGASGVVFLKPSAGGNILRVKKSAIVR